MRFQGRLSAPVPYAPIKVLLVEDDPAQARLVREYLEPSGRRAVALEYAESLAEAKQRLAIGGIQVLLLDLALTDSTGPGTFMALRWAFRDLPIVVLTGLQDDQLSEGLVQVGAQDYLVKGEITGPLLYRTIRHAIERKHLEEQQERLVNELRETAARVHSLSGLLPICGSCKKIRDGKGAWNQLEDFITANSAASFSHGLCPDCIGDFLPDGANGKSP